MISDLKLISNYKIFQAIYGKISSQIFTEEYNQTYQNFLPKIKEYYEYLKNGESIEAAAKYLQKRLETDFGYTANAIYEKLKLINEYTPNIQKESFDGFLQGKYAAAMQKTRKRFMLFHPLKNSVMDRLKLLFELGDEKDFLALHIFSAIDIEINNGGILATDFNKFEIKECVGYFQKSPSLVKEPDFSTSHTLSFYIPSSYSKEQNFADLDDFSIIVFKKMQDKILAFSFKDGEILCLSPFSDTILRLFSTRDYHQTNNEKYQIFTQNPNEKYQNILKFLSSIPKQIPKSSLSR